MSVQARLTCVISASVVLTACSAGFYRNSTPAGSTVADEDAILSITKAATVLATLSEQQLGELARETGPASIQYAGLEKLQSGSFEFACWLPCTRQPKVLGAAGSDLMTLKHIEAPAPDGHRLHERWTFDDRGNVRTFQVVFIYSAGGGGDSILSAYLRRKPDLFRITAQ